MMYGDRLSPKDVAAAHVEQRDVAWGVPPPWPNALSRRPIRAASVIWIIYLLVLIAADYAVARASNGTGMLPSA